MRVNIKATITLLLNDKVNDNVNITITLILKQHRVNDNISHYLITYMLYYTYNFTKIYIT
jgi:hypothetical protein